MSENKLQERLRGNYTVPVRDGAGPLNGKAEFSRSFPVPPICIEAADALDAAEVEIARLKEAVTDLGADVLRLHKEKCDAFLAGQESMRESASKEVPTNWCHNLLSGPESSRMPLSQQGVEKLLLGIKNNIRSLPLLEEPNKEVAG